MIERNKVTLNDIVGIIKTDTPTNSVELKKETYDGYNRFTYVLGDGFEDYGKHLNVTEVCELLNKYYLENNELHQSINQLKETICKITSSVQRKYDNTVVNIVDEVYEEDISDLIKEIKKG